MTNSKRKIKFKSAVEKAAYIEALNSEFGVAKKRKTNFSIMNNPLVMKVPPGRETQRIPSLGNGIGNALLKEKPVYTGTAMKGIGTLHKSNAVPVFTDDEAKDLSSMRR